MAARQREISVSEFFLKNRHLLGFDTPSKALVTAVKEAVDNALDACEEAGILPEISVQVRHRQEKSRVVVEDNGPGIAESQIARIFGKLLYGSKFHKLSQSRGQHGMGISAAGMYGQLTVGKPQLLEGLHKELDADFYTVTTRPAAAYRGNPFQVEVAIAYGRRDDVGVEVDESGHMRKKEAHGKSAAEHLIARKNEPVRLLRFANRVPLLYRHSSCAITKAVIQTNWRAYGLHQPKGALPIAPMAVLVHVASVWVPYTSESKEAIEPYPEIAREIRLGLQQCGRELAHYLRRTTQLQREYDRRVYIEKYLPHIGIALQDILALSEDERDSAVKKLDDVLHKSRTT